MGSQWEFYKIAQKSAVSINSQAKTFLETNWIQTCQVLRMDLSESFFAACKFRARSVTIMGKGGSVGCLGAL